MKTAFTFPKLYMSYNIILQKKVLVWADTELDYILFVAVCQKLSRLDQCSRMPAELTKARINICVECSDRDGHDRDTGDKTTRDVGTRRQHPMILAVIPIYWLHCFRLTDARETWWKVHCVWMTFSAITFMWAAEREEDELAFWPSAPGLENKR